VCSISCKKGVIFAAAERVEYYNNNTENGTIGLGVYGVETRIFIAIESVDRGRAAYRRHVRGRGEGQFKNGDGLESHRCAPRQISRQFTNNVTSCAR